MRHGYRSRLLVLASLVAWAAAATGAQGAAGGSSAGLDQAFQAAVASYDAKQFSAAAAQLEKLLPQAPEGFAVHELLGLTYGAQSLDAKAIEQLALAVRLQPNAADARVNLATALAHAGKAPEAEEQCRKALAIAPADYAANHNLAELSIQAGRVREAIPLLETAQRARPDAYANSYDLALAYLVAGRMNDARQIVEGLLAGGHDAGELHTLLGHIDEKDGKFVEAANEFSAAAHLDPSEENLFAWGSELLLHRTYEPAIHVFTQASERYPKSPRLLIGLGMALYSRGEYEQSIHALLAAADLNPHDPRCYLFLSKAYLSSPNQAEEVIDRFRRYAELEPGAALAQYYYAISLWKGRRMEDPNVNYAAVESLLHKSIALDATLADAHLQLGILYNEQHDYARSYPEYERALQLNANLPDVHYRLGQYFVHVKDKVRAQEEFELFKKLQAQHQAQLDKERAEVEQFVVAGNGAAKP